MSDRFQLKSLSLKGLTLAERKPIRDRRGFLERMFCAEEFAAVGIDKPVVQINRTLTRHRGTIRGMHYQHPPHAEVKIISCLQGEIFDVAIDLRSRSPTFLKWHGEILSDKNARMLVVPEGCAHGFQTLTDDCELLYFHTAAYTPSAEDGVHCKDPLLQIDWPLPVAALSERDASHAFLDANYAGIALGEGDFMGSFEDF